MTLGALLRPAWVVVATLDDVLCDAWQVEAGEAGHWSVPLPSFRSLGNHGVGANRVQPRLIVENEPDPFFSPF